MWEKQGKGLPCAGRLGVHSGQHLPPTERGLRGLPAHLGDDGGFTMAAPVHRLPRVTCEVLWASWPLGWNFLCYFPSSRQNSL